MRQGFIKNIPPWATVFTLLSLILLICLGTWQIKRLEWKNNLINSLNSAYKKDYIDYSLVSLPKEAKQYSYIKAKISGKVDNNKCFFLGPRTNNGKNGFHLLCALLLNDKKQLLINLGWVEASPNNIELPTLNTSILTNTKHQYLGALRAPPSTNLFTPENQPLSNRWFYINLEQIKDYFGLEEIEPFVFYNHSALPSELNVTPHSTVLSIKNDHMGYAVFWYLSAAILLLFYYLRFFKNN